MIVTDESLHRLGLIEKLKTVLDSKEISYYIYDKTVPNPTVVNVEEARELYLANDCRAIIGFGGGSPMDCAKAVGARVVKPKQPIPSSSQAMATRNSVPCSPTTVSSIRN